MKVNLSKKEREFLQGKVFWEWKYAEIDLWSIKAFSNDPARLRPIEEAEEFYRKLYVKLGGRIKAMSHEHGRNQKDNK